MQCKKCNSSRVEKISSWQATKEEQENAKRSRMVNAALHTGGGVSLAITAATCLYKGLATNMFECKSCGHRFRNY